jgi:hypothetical protein
VTPFVPPIIRPGSLNILVRLSKISSGIRNNTPVKVSSKILMNLEQQFPFEKFCGSKSPWENFMPMIQLYWAINVAARAMNEIVRAIW